jgi:hypothetical protein
LKCHLLSKLNSQLATTRALQSLTHFLFCYWTLIGPSRNSGEHVTHRKETKSSEDVIDGRFPLISATSRNSLKSHDINRDVTLPNAQNFPVIGPLRLG